MRFWVSQCTKQEFNNCCLENIPFEVILKFKDSHTEPAYRQDMFKMTFLKQPIYNKKNCSSTHN